MIDKMSRCLENSLRFFFSCQGQIFSRGKGLGVNKVPVLPRYAGHVTIVSGRSRTDLVNLGINIPIR